MTTTTEQLAEALRDALPFLGTGGNPANLTAHQRAGVAAREALAAYDADQVARAPQPLGRAPRGTL